MQQKPVYHRLSAIAPPRAKAGIPLLILAVFVIAAKAHLYAAAPVITNVSPTRGATAGGTIVLLSGTGFTGATEVTFGNAAASFVVQSDTSIQATSPAGAVGLVDIVVSTPQGSMTLQQGFGYGTIPVAVNDSYNFEYNKPLSVSSPGVLANDDTNGGGGWVAELGTNVTNGTLTFGNDGNFNYVPNTGFAGADKFTYRTLNSTGYSNYATVTLSVTALNEPLPPTGLYASEIRDNRVTLRFTPPAIGLTPTAYIIEAGLTPGGVTSTFIIAPTPIFSLDAPNGLFYFRVRTRSGASLSGPSNEIVVLVNIPAVPSAPENFIASVVGNTLHLAWRNSYGGGTPSLIVLDVAGSAAATLPLSFTDKTTFTGVPAGTYTLNLRAINATGSSFPSTPVTITVPDACSGVPLTPTNFLAYRTGSTIHVLWEPAATGAAPTSYVLNVTGAFVGSFATTERSMSGTVGAGAYTITVNAVNACGVSAATAAQTVTIPTIP
jgi:hypothetical protein